MGKGIANAIINKLPFELHLPGHNFTGTNFKKRLKDPFGNHLDFTPQPWSKSINRVDEAAVKHIFVIYKIMIQKLEMKFVIKRCYKI